MFSCFKLCNNRLLVKCNFSSTSDALLNSKHFVLLDGSNLINKCYYTTRKLEVCPGIIIFLIVKDPKHAFDQSTATLYYFLQTLMYRIKEFPSKYVLF